ncbi:hypothetical protein BJX68DRAFT_232786 [Aspergillus pseudodeflectus]|uniref:AT DNA binding protein n=1 Tax=Aspergillus pseudodeflectus TaxID=176178 RepID=A0ABR4KP81_9EURO
MEPPERPAKGSSSGRARRTRPRPTGSDSPEDKDSREKRRMQVRMAQRAYRARNQAQAATLQRRIVQLESALEQMGSAVVSFSDALVQSGVRTSFPNLADPLRGMVATCLSLAEANEEGGDGLPHHPPEEAQRSSGIEYSLSPNRDVFHDAYRSAMLAGFNPNTKDTPIDVPDFIEQLRIACLYHGFVMLNNPKIPLELLWRPFRLLLTLVPRDTITSFFRARLVARLNKRPPEAFAEIPFFQLGGAGTHYPELYLPPEHSREWETSTASSPLSAFSPEVQGELEGEWFDMHDLAGYLRENEVCIVSPMQEEVPRTRRTVKALDFTSALIEKSICLGHSPGFRRSDVERAIALSLLEK